MERAAGVPSCTRGSQQNHDFKARRDPLKRSGWSLFLYYQANNSSSCCRRYLYAIKAEDTYSRTTVRDLFAWRGPASYIVMLRAIKGAGALPLRLKRMEDRMKKKSISCRCYDIERSLQKFVHRCYKRIKPLPSSPLPARPGPAVRRTFSHWLIQNSALGCRSSARHTNSSRRLDEKEKPMHQKTVDFPHWPW